MLPKELIRFNRYFEIDEITGCWNWTLKPKNTGYGRLTVGSIKTGNRRQELAHRLSFEHFKGPLGLLFACHTCDNPLCVNPDHLFAGTALDNNQDKHNKGRQKFGDFKGIKNPRSILNDKQVIEIVKLLSELSNTDIGKIYNVHHSTISLIRLGKKWSHLTGIKIKEPRIS